MYLWRQVHVHPPRNDLQICRCLQQDELRLQTLEAALVDDAVQSTNVDAVNVVAYDGFSVILERLLMID